MVFQYITTQCNATQLTGCSIREYQSIINVDPLNNLNLLSKRDYNAGSYEIMTYIGL